MQGLYSQVLADNGPSSAVVYCRLALGDRTEVLRYWTISTPSAVRERERERESASKTNELSSYQLVRYSHTNGELIQSAPGDSSHH
jgi:hypothetical protein